MVKKKKKKKSHAPKTHWVFKVRADTHCCHAVRTYAADKLSIQPINGGSALMIGEKSADERTNVHILGLKYTSPHTFVTHMFFALWP